MRVMMFVDGQNLYDCLKQAYGVERIDWVRFRDWLASGRQIVRMYYYNARLLPDRHGPEAVASQDQFFAYLTSLDHVEVRLGRLQRRTDGVVVQKGVDVRIAVDMVYHALRGHADVIVLVSGDADLAEAARVVKAAGCIFENVFPRLGSSKELRQVADVFREITEKELRLFGRIVKQG